MEIGLSKVSKSYGDNLILKNVDLTIYDNEITSIVAPNGTGKTTFLNLIAGMISAESGKIKYSDEIKPSDIFFVYGGDKGLYLKNTVEENIKYISLMKGIDINHIKENIIKYNNTIINYDELKNVLCEKLSHGQKRMVSIFISIITESKVLIMDETTEGLDCKNITKIIDTLKKIKENRIVLICSHDYDFVENISDKVYFLTKGDFLLANSNKDIKDKFINIFGKEN